MYTVEPKTADNSIVSTIKLPEPAKVEQSVSVTLVLLRKNTGNARGYTSVDSVVSAVSIPEGETEGKLALDVDFTAEDYYYTMQVMGGSDYSMMDENFELTDEYVVIDEKTHPLKSFVLELPASFLKEPPKEYVPETTEVNNEVLDQLRQVINAGPFSKHEKLKDFTKPEDSLTIEEEEPVEYDDAGTHYYSKEFDSGYYLFSSYYLDEYDPYLEYSMNVNNVVVTEADYIDVFNALSSYLAEAVGSEKTLAQVYDFRSDKTTTIEECESSELFEDLQKGYVCIQARVKKDDVHYLIDFSGGNGEEVYISLNASIKVN